jgi:hypothetical protein
MGFPNIAIIWGFYLVFSKYFMQFLEISWDFGILGFSKILGFFQRFFFIFDEVYEDFQSNLPLDLLYHVQNQRIKPTTTNILVPFPI